MGIRVPLAYSFGYPTPKLEESNSGVESVRRVGDVGYDRHGKR